MNRASDLKQIRIAIVGTISLAFTGLFGYLFLSELSKKYPEVENMGLLRDFTKSIEILQSSPEIIIVVSLVILGIIVKAFNTGYASPHKQRIGRA